MAVWLVADFEALLCQVTTTFDTSCAARIPTAPAINYTACYRLVFIHFSHFLFQFATFILSVKRWERHTLLQFLVCVSACANCKCVWLLALALFRYYSVFLKILCLFKDVFIHFVSFYWRISVFVQENY